MGKICDCNAGLGNTGSPNCVPIADVTRKLVLVPLYDNTGAINEYQVSATTFNSVFFNARINDVDKSKRWYPTPEIENIEDLRGDPIFETLNNGKNIFVQQGTRPFSGVMLEMGPEFLEQIEKASCLKFGAFIVDKQGNLIGNGKAKDGYLRPIRIDQNTWNPRLLKASDTVSAKVQLNFEWDILEEDSQIRMVSAADMSGYALNDIRGLVDIVGAAATNISTTGFKMKMNTFYGTLKSLIDVKGLLITDFSIYNVTDSLAVTILTMTESPLGTYAFTFAAQTSADVLELRVAEDGFDDTELRKIDILIP